MTEEYTLISGYDTQPLRLNAVQGEAGARTFLIYLRDGSGAPAVGSDDTAYAYVCKPDHTLVVMDCQASTGSVTFTLSLQACACPGVCPVFIQTISGEGESRTETRWENILLFVAPCDLEGAVASTDDLGPLADLITDPHYLDEVKATYEKAIAGIQSAVSNFVYTGEYDPEKSYQPLNQAGYQGDTYIALRETTGNPPTDSNYWGLFAKGGSPGPQGEQGPPGTGLTVLDQYDTQALLEEAVPDPEPGDNYYVGPAPPYDVYTYTETKGWVNGEKIQGPAGAAGPANSLEVGTVETLPPGSAATAEITGEAPNQTLHLGLPQGAVGSAGPANTLAVGTVETLSPDSAATARITGVAPNQTLHLGIPQGKTGGKGDPGTTSWYDLTDKPQAFPPEDHEHVPGDIPGIKDSIESTGSSGVWKWEIYASGRMRIWGNIPVSNIATGTTMGSLYRSGEAYNEQSYPYPKRFLSTPTVSMAYYATNFNGALVWPVLENETNLRSYPPTCYLVRTNNVTTTGFVSVIAEGYYN